MQAIGNKMDRLEQLDISRCRSVTDYGVELLFSNVNKSNKNIRLKKLAVQGCPSIGEHSTTLIERKLGLTTPLFTKYLTMNHFL
ncbi:hypothetical protein BDA99DRAFT_498734 [Phascolomyces articulosus]|uniref:Uncharacterized protein n=1 Tax=Phascolomyces articulosus TaxID=60185 RepID=A0AAD5K916_9FUNG|nr:hypothetical protein BDA99DRAFT_498734 [Phascolomyces articulosus]